MESPDRNDFRSGCGRGRCIPRGAVGATNGHYPGRRFFIVTIYMYFLSQTLFHYRLLDLSSKAAGGAGQ